MRPALPCLRYVPKHAAPREPLALETRSALAVGLAAALLPLGAAPALADGTPAPDTGTATTTTSSLEQPVTAAPEPAAPTASAAPSAAGEQESSPYAVGPSASPSASPAPAPAQRSSTSLSLSAPSSARAKAVPVGIRLLADGRAVKNGYVRLEKSTAQGWTYVGRLLTDADGVGRGTLRVAGSTTLRAAYSGSQVRTPAVSVARTVKAAATSGAAVLDEAAKHVGKPYVYGATGPGSFDCSGYTRYVYAKATGRSLPHNARAQERAATPVRKADAQPGDLVFMQDVAGHVGIYAGNGRMYDAPRSGKKVSLRRMWSSNYTVGRVS